MAETRIRAKEPRLLRAEKYSVSPFLSATEFPDPANPDDPFWRTIDNRNLHRLAMTLAILAIDQCDPVNATEAQLRYVVSTAKAFVSMTNCRQQFEEALKASQIKEEDLHQDRV